VRIPSLAAVAVAVSAASVLGSAGLADEPADMVDYTVVDYAIPEALTDLPGDPDRGRAVAINRQLGNCLSCHAMPIPEQAFHGETGPDLRGVGDRYTAAQLRLQVVDAHAINPDSMMPAFYAVAGRHRVSDAFEGKPIIDAQQVEDVVAYLMTLKD
jgi:sulfur-oxidizing protein SoxX